MGKFLHSVFLNDSFVAVNHAIQDCGIFQLYFYIILSIEMNNPAMKFVMLYIHS